MGAVQKYAYTAPPHATPRHPPSAKERRESYASNVDMHKTGKCWGRELAIKDP